MASYILILFIFGLLVQYLLIKLGKKFNIISKSNFRRKVDEGVPLTGGIGILLTLLFSQFFIRDEHSSLMLVAAIPVIIVALLDDILELRAIYKVFFQLISSISFLYLYGVENLFYYKLIQNESAALIISALFMIVAMNSYNFLDGVDGQLSIVSLIATITIGLITKFQSTLLIPLIIGNICFFIFNGYRAKIYLGDLGSSLLGFILSAMALQVDPVNSPWVSFWGMNFIFSLAFCDVWAAIFRRMRRGQNPWAGDKEHFHHKLERLGFGSLSIVLVTGSMMFISSIVGYYILTSSAIYINVWSVIIIGSLTLSLVYFGVFALEKIKGFRMREIIHIHLEKRHTSIENINIFSSGVQFLQFDLSCYVYEIQKYSVEHFEQFLNSLGELLLSNSGIYYKGDLKLILKSHVQNKQQISDFRVEIISKIKSLLERSRFLFYDSEIPAGLKFISTEDLASELAHLKSNVSDDFGRKLDKTFKQS